MGKNKAERAKWITPMDFYYPRIKVLLYDSFKFVNGKFWI